MSKMAFWKSSVKSFSKKQRSMRLPFSLQFQAAEWDRISYLLDLLI